MALAIATISVSTSPSVLANCAARTSSAARSVKSPIPVPRGSTITTRSRRLRVRRPSPTLGRGGITADLPAAANGQYVERLAFVIGGTPQIHPLADDSHHHRPRFRV